MPRMPSRYQAGNAVVEIAPTPRLVQGPSTVAGLGQAANAVMDVAGDAMNRNVAEQNAMERQRQQVMAADAREQAAEQKRIGRIRAANSAVDFELQVGEARENLDDQLARGIIKPDAYEAEMTKFIGEAKGKLREGLDPDTHLDFDQAALRPERAAMIGTSKALKAHGKREAAAELDKGREGLLRVAVGDLPRALAMGDALYSREGPYAAQIGIDAAQKQGQSFKENATRAHFLRRIADGQNSGGALAQMRREIAGNADLDPTQQAALLGSIDSRSSVLENRGIAAADRSLRVQEQAFKALQDLDAQGLPMDAEFVSRTMSTLKGSPLAVSAAALVQGSAQTASFGAQPLAKQDQILQALYADARAKGVNPATSARIKKLDGIRDAQATAIKADPWQASLERGDLDGIPPIKVDSLAGVGQSLVERMALVPSVDRRAGHVVSPLRPEEADALGQALSALPVPERSKMLGGIQKALTDADPATGNARMRAVIAQLGVKDTTLASAALYQAQGMPNESQLVLRGADARKNKTVKIDEAAGTGIEAQLDQALEGVYANPKSKEAAKEAALNIYAGKAADGKRVSVEEAIRIATGGVTEHNGQKIPMPFNWTERQVKRSIASITPEYLQTQPGGDKPIWLGTDRQMLPEDVARILPRAQLRSAGSGPDGKPRYAVRIGETLLTTDGRKPFTITLPEVK